MEQVDFSRQGLPRQLHTATDDRADESKTIYDNSIPKHEDWQEEPWFSGFSILRDQMRSAMPTAKKAPIPYLEQYCEHRSSKEHTEEDLNMEGFSVSCNESMIYPDSFKPTPIIKLSRPPMVRSYGSSSASSASTLMTPRDVHSWASSAHSPLFIESIEPVPPPSPYHLHVSAPSKLVMDTSIGDFPTSRDFRFPANPMSSSPDPPDFKWFLDDHEEAINLPTHSCCESIRPKRSQKDHAVRCYGISSKQTCKATANVLVPGLGVITQNGTYNEGTNFTSKSRVRHGPLTPEQRHDAALMRRYGACRDCRKRKIKCNVRHRSSGTNTTSSTPPPQEYSISIPSVVIAVLILQRCIERRYLKLFILPDDLDLQISDQISRQASCFENMNLQGIDFQSMLVRSQVTTQSSDANSLNSFEDDLTECSHGDSALRPSWEMQDAGAEELLAAIQPLLDQLPSEISASLSNELLSLFGIWLGNRPAYQQMVCDDTPSSSNSQSRPGNTSTPTNSTGSVPKRLSDDGSGYSNPSGNGGDGQRKRPRNVSLTPSGASKRWACPYYQKDPHFYCVAGEFGDYRKCSRSPGFSQVHRVKQHLAECHIAIYCTRCYTQFKNKDALIDHSRSTTRCEIRNSVPLQGLHADQRELLRPRDRNKSEEERWRTVYKICFPTDQVIPTPYYIHYTQEIALLRREILQIVEEETMYIDGTIRERLLRRIQPAFDSNSQNAGPSESLNWSSHSINMSNDFMPSHLPPVSNPAPWSEWATRHTNPEQLGHSESAPGHQTVLNTANPFAGPSIEAAFIFNDDPNFGYNFETPDGHHRDDLNDNE